MLRNVSTDGWKQAIEEENILQKLSVSSSKRIANLIKSRLEMMKLEFWKMIRDGRSQTATHAVFAVSIKHCRILGDYLDLVVREQFRRLEDHLTHRLWDDFIMSCKQRDPLMSDFSTQTNKKMRNNVHNILFEVGYIIDQHSLASAPESWLSLLDPRILRVYSWEYFKKNIP